MFTVEMCHDRLTPPFLLDSISVKTIENHAITVKKGLHNLAKKIKIKIKSSTDGSQSLFVLLVHVVVL